MNFLTAIVMLTLAVAANASVLPLGLGWNNAVNAWGDGTWGGPSAWGGHGAWGGPGVWGAGAWGDGAWGHGAWGAPAAVVAPAIVAAHGAPVGHAGSYVAANRGSVHVAPLAGHIQSVKSLNVAPAPGTW